MNRFGYFTATMRWAIVRVGLIVGFATATAHFATAQPPDASNSAPSSTSAAKTASAAPAPAPTSGPGPASAASANEKAALKSRSFFDWMLEASGPIGWLILAMSFYLIALVVWMFLRYRKEAALPPALIRQLNDLLVQKSYTEAYHRLTTDDSFLAKVLAAGVKRLPAGLANAQRAMETANEDVTMEMEHRTTYLATVGTLGPMIGLVGTVYGMIMSFRVIATAGAAPQASDLALGISTALFATLEGISISIPAIYFYSLFRNRIARLSLEVAVVSEGLLEQFAQGVRSPHPLAASAGGGVPALRRPTVNPSSE